MDFKFLHIADPHVDSPMRALERYEGAPHAEMRLSTRRAFEAAVDLAIAEGVALVVLAGDLYDGDWRDHNTGLFVCRQLARLTDAGIRVIGIAGNHDAQSVLTKRLPLPRGVQFLSTRAPESVELEDLGVVVHGQGYATRNVTDDLSAKYPPASEGYFDIGLLHTCATGYAGHEPYAPCAIEDLVAREYRYWALGHVHAYQVLHRDPWIVFPGNTQGRHWREAGTKGVVLVTVEDGEVRDVSRRQTDVSRWATVEVDAASASGRDDVLAAARDELAAAVEAADGLPLAARVVVSGSTPAHRALIAAGRALDAEVQAIALDVGPAQLWIERVDVRTAPAHALEVLHERRDPLARLVAEFRAREDDPDRLLDAVPEVEKLGSRLPPAAVRGDHAVALDDRAYLDERLAAAEQVLLARLAGAA